MKMKNGRKRFVTEYAGLFCMEPVIVLTTFGVSALYNIPTEYMIYLIALNIAVWLMVLCIQYRFFKKKNDCAAGRYFVPTKNLRCKRTGAIFYQSFNSSLWRRRI